MNDEGKNVGVPGQILWRDYEGNLVWIFPEEAENNLYKLEETLKKALQQIQKIREIDARKKTLEK